MRDEVTTGMEIVGMAAIGIGSFVAFGMGFGLIISGALLIAASILGVDL